MDRIVSDVNPVAGSAGFIRVLFLAALAAFESGCGRSSTTDAGSAPPSATPPQLLTVMGPKAISSASPFAAGCGPETLLPFGDKTEDAEMEAHLAVNPLDPSNVVVAWMQDLWNGLVVAASYDGGEHWAIAPLPGTSTCSGGPMDIAADPWLSFGPDGVAYLSGFSLDLPVEQLPTPHRTRLFAATSTDGGLSWSEPVTIVGGLSLLHDQSAIFADPSRPCVAYVIWVEHITAFGPVSTGLDFARTLDCGATWSAPTVIFQPLLNPITPLAIAVGPKLLVQPDGTLLAVATVLPTLLSLSNPEIPDLTQPMIVAFRSLDGGASWSPPITVADFANGPFHDPETGEKVLASPYILSAAVAPDGVSYIAYRYQLSQASADIRVVRSADAGLNWSDPIVVRAAGKQMMHAVIAAGSDGDVAVTYYDIRNDRPGDDALTTDLWLSRSTDQGASWSEAHVAGPFDLRSAAYMRIPTEGLMVGEYSGLAALPGGRFAAAFAMANPQATTGASDVFFAVVGEQAQAR